VLHQPFAINHLDAFIKRLQRAKSILFIGDNAGEKVFDRVLIEALPIPVVYAVKGGPTLNDATLDDAMEAELIIAKGQGNYETLSDRGEKVFCLLQVKCPVIAADIGAPEGSIVIQQADRRTSEKADGAYLSPKMIGSPSFPLPTTTTFVLGDSASLSVA